MIYHFDIYAQPHVALVKLMTNSFVFLVGSYIQCIWFELMVHQCMVYLAHISLPSQIETAIEELPIY